MDDTDVFGSFGLLRMNLSDKALFGSAFATTHPQLSDYTFANTFIWQDAIHLRWKMLHGCLCVFANGQDGLSLLFPPIGEGDFPAALDEAIDICTEFNRRMGVEQTPRVEYVSQALLAKFSDESIVRPMSGDYIYPTRRMIDLDGSDLGSKRKGRSWFLRHHDPRTEPLTAAWVPACMELLTRWRDQAETTVDPNDTAQSTVRMKRAKEIAATGVALEHFEAIDLKGMVLLAGETLIGFTLGELLPDGQTCSILIEKTDRDYRGSANYIFSEFCRQYWAETTWCNAGDDWELPSLAWTKQSYQPSARLQKWVVWPKRSPRLVARFQPRAKLKSVEAPAPATQFDKAQPADLRDLLLLESCCFSAGEAFNRRQLRYLLRSPRSTTFLIREEGQIVAAAVVSRRRTVRGVHARLYSMAVSPKHRRRGFGRMLIEACMKSLHAEGVQSISLEVRQDNAPAIALYESMGFAVTNPLTDYYGPGAAGWRMTASVPPVPMLPFPA